MKRKLLRILAVLLGLVLAGSLLVAALSGLVVLTEKPNIVDPGDVLQADCILVLGCGLFPDGTPGYMLTNRLNTAIDLYGRGAAPKLLMSGDHGTTDYDEVNAMKRYAVEHGVPAEAVFMDHAGFSTYESMVRARTIFGCSSVIVVTQPYHLYRALWDAERQGMRAQGVASAMHQYSWRYEHWLFFREILARAKDVGFCLLQVPVTGGDAISIHGSGSLSDDEATAVWLSELATD